jgi:hypothetical protein
MFTVQHVLIAAIFSAVGFMLILMFMPETKSLSLEELDAVFSISTRHHAMYQLRQIPIWLRKTVLRQKNVKEQGPLFEPIPEKEKTFGEAAAAA